MRVEAGGPLGVWAGGAPKKQEPDQSKVKELCPWEVMYLSELMGLPWCVPGAGRCPSCGLSRAKPAWLRGGMVPAKAPVDGEGKLAKVWV